MATKEPQKAKKAEATSQETGQDEPEVTALFDQPLVLEGKRKRKSVEMFSFSPSQTTHKKETKAEYQGGEGVKLGDIAIIQYNINKTKSDDLKLLHRICFDSTIQIGKAAIKKNLRTFSGWTFTEESEDYKKRKQQLERILVADLQYLLEFLDLDKNGTKQDLVRRILEFLAKPVDSGRAAPLPRKRKASVEKASTKKKPKKDQEEKDDEDEADETKEDIDETPKKADDKQTEEEGEGDSNDRQEQDGDNEMETEKQPDQQEEEEMATEKQQQDKKEEETKGEAQPAADDVAPEQGEEEGEPQTTTEPVSNKEE